MIRRKNLDTAAPQKTGIRWTLFAYLAVFCAAVLLMIWVVQVFLLDQIYYGIQLSRMEDAATTLAAVSVSDKAQTGADAVSVSYDVALAVFSVKDDDLGERLMWSGGPSGAVLGKLKNAEYTALYAEALQNNGTYTKEFSDRYAFENGGGGRLPQTIVSRRMVYVRLLDDAAGQPIAVFLDAAIIPQGAQANAVMAEIILLSVILILAALLLAQWLSRRIAAPIARVTEGAKQLAAGRYDTKFEAGGYREIEELSATLNYAASELSKVDSLQKELIANVSHDLRTPLTTIIGYAEIMRDIAGENKPENVQVIIDEAKRLSDLVNDLLEISRYQAGTVHLAPTPFSVSDMVEETAARYRRLLEARGYTFRVVCDTDLTVTADRARILQVLYNLIHNAVNYTGEDKEITLTCRKTEDGWARVEVIDRGEGIPADQLPNIWQRYYKVDAQHKRSVVGSGLGLSIVRGILEAHLARYGVDSRVGEGSRFWFALPVDTVAELMEE